MILEPLTGGRDRDREGFQTDHKKEIENDPRLSLTTPPHC
jgi:hypothetical protein